MLRVISLPEKYEFLSPYIDKMQRDRFEDDQKLSVLGYAIVKAEVSGFLTGLLQHEEISKHPDYPQFIQDLKIAYFNREQNEANVSK